MPPEYLSRGQVSPRTDAFAYGIVTIELITGLHPVAARELIEEYEPDELPDLIKRFHDGDTRLEKEIAKAASARGGSRGWQQQYKPRARCVWPPAALDIVTSIAVRTSYLRPKRRAEVRDILPELEELLQPRASAEELRRAWMHN